MTEIAKFGEQIKLEHFHLDKSTTFCNHGSYGTVPKSILAKKHRLQLDIDSAPDAWFKYISFEHWTHNKKCLADYLDVNYDNLLICDSATDAINAAMKSIDFNGHSDAIISSQYTYKAISNSVDYVSKYRQEEGKEIQVFPIPCVFPIKNKEEILNEFEKTLNHVINEKKLRVRLVLIDHIASATAVLYPIKEMIQIVRKLTNKDETLIMIDGAHAIGQLEIKLNDLDCDYYISNLHKWFLAPRGCSFLWLKDPVRLGKGLQPNYISHGYDKDLDYNFYRRGTADKTSFFCIDECIQFYQEKLGGLKSIQDHANKVLPQALDLLLKGWNTVSLGISKDLEAPYMKMIKLPFMKNYQAKSEAEASSSLANLLKDLYEKHKIVGMVVIVQKELWLRISCYVYNDLKDYELLRDAILDLQK